MASSISSSCPYLDIGVNANTADRELLATREKVGENRSLFVVSVSQACRECCYPPAKQAIEGKKGDLVASRLSSSLVVQCPHHLREVNLETCAYVPIRSCCRRGSRNLQSPHGKQRLPECRPVISHVSGLSNTRLFLPFSHGAQLWGHQAAVGLAALV